jgi:hypothetical protein
MGIIGYGSGFRPEHVLWWDKFIEFTRLEISKTELAHWY